MFLSFPNMQLFKIWILVSNCIYSIRIVFNFDLSANLTRTYEENNTCCTFGLLKDIIMNFKYIMIGELSEPEKFWNTHTQTHPWLCLKFYNFVSGESYFENSRDDGGPPTPL